MPATRKRPRAQAKQQASKTTPRRTRQQKAADLAGIAGELRDLLAKYSPPFVVRTNSKGGFLLYSEKEIEVDGGIKDEMFFAAMIPQKGYVGFYYMPVYTIREQRDFFKPELLKLRKGKTCFYVRHLEPEVKKQIKKALADGFRLYKQRGWI